MAIIWPKPLPAWIEVAMKYRGLREIPGKAHAPKIQLMLKKLKAWWSDDETPWCGVFVGFCLKEVGLAIPKNWMRARDYEGWGIGKLIDPIPFGSVCTKTRVGGGHVFFAVAQTRDGQTVFGLGGNQSNMVNITAFKRKDITAVRWPSDTSAPVMQLPFATSAELAAASIGGSEA